MKVSLILKGVLLYTALLVSILTVMGVETLYDNGNLLYAISASILLLYWCKKQISREESDILSLNKFFRKHNL